MKKQLFLLGLALLFGFSSFADECWSEPFRFDGSEITETPILLQPTDSIAYSSALAQGESRSLTIDVKDVSDPSVNAVIFNAISQTGIEGTTSWNYLDEAYADFSDENCLSLAMKYDNVLVVRTFSKSRSMAGARLGYAVGNEKLIEDLNKVKDSIDPYNVNRMTSAAGIAAIEDNDYYMANCERIRRTRARTAAGLEALGFTVLKSSTNFVFARHREIGGERIYRLLKENGVLVRHFDGERIRDFNRITIGSDEQMDRFFTVLGDVLKKEQKGGD